MIVRALWVVGFASLTLAAFADPAKGLTTLGRFEVERQALPESEPFPVVSGSGKNWLSVPFGGEFTLMIWESAQGKLAIDRPFPYDQYVEVLKGELIMTDTDGNSNTYTKADRFVLQKGFTGTWHMTEDYRELIIINTRSMIATESKAD